MRFPDLEDIVAEHDLIIERYGGSYGILSLGPIEAALDRMAWGPFPAQGDLFERAALLLRGIAQDHPFWDGNTRTAYAATKAFIEANGHGLRLEGEDRPLHARCGPRPDGGPRNGGMAAPQGQTLFWRCTRMTAMDRRNDAKALEAAIRNGYRPRLDPRLRRSFERQLDEDDEAMRRLAES